MRKTHSGDTFRVGGSNEESGVPAQGKRRIPIILAEFKDKKFTNTREEIIEAMLTGNESVGQYFRDQSNGLYEPKFDVYGIYTLSKNREYYGGHSGADNDRALGAFVTEAVQMAAADGVSFSPFDTNSDNYCDVVIVIYAGVGEAQASYNHPEAVWPCNWNLQSAAYYGLGGNGAFRPNGSGPYVNNFAVFNELHGSNDGIALNTYLVVVLITFLQTSQDADAGEGVWLIHHDRLETTLQGLVLLEILLVFVEGGGTNAAQLTSCQCRLQDVGSIHSTFALTSAYQCVYLIDKQDDVTI
jgi:hypothetical protein